ncbi:glycosyltransferase [Trinickia mobilis]|uniref:glycosyltransferase n=1 Tax=Trinickia mobilis TaxID=2816356 RepID=UPI001A8D9EF2|nr:glycosyltransferase [Trinickia mobilis]
MPGTDDPSCRWPVRVKSDAVPGATCRSGKRTFERLLQRFVGERTWGRLVSIRRRLGARPAMFFKLYLKPEYAESIYWSWPNIKQLNEAGAGVKADLYLANDWTALPIAARLAAESGGIYVYDSHEFATTEFAQRWQWRLIYRPIARYVEKRYIANAKVISAVSSGISDALEELYRLPTKPEVIRNAPQFSESRFRPTGDKIRLLYHGIVAPGRGLEEAIASVPLWREEYSFFIRGPGDEAYLESLRNQIRDMKLESRVTMLPPVPMIDLVAKAREFDVGFFALKGHSLQNEFVLPNKFFEYTMAGLALCVSDLREMTQLCHQYKHGVVFEGLEKETIASAVNGLTREVIDRMKRAAIAAAPQLCWGNESDRMLALYDEALAKNGAVLAK